MEVSQEKGCDKATGNEGAPKSDSGKKMKQSRLPFHPIDVTSQKAGQGTKKKRKLTGDETPSPKLPKVQKTKDAIEKIPSLDLEGDHEVSSSCEAENVPLACPQKPTILDRFIKKTPHEEITSTIEVVDLTATEEEPTQRSEVSSSKDQQDKKAGEGDPSKAQKGSGADLCSEEVNESSYSSVSKEEKGVDETGDEGKPAVTDGQAGEAQDTSMEISAEENTASESEADKSKLNDSSEVMDTSATSPRDTSDGETPSKRPRTSRACASSSKKTSPASGTSQPRSKLSEERRKRKQQERQQLKEKKEKEMQEKKEMKQQEKEERLRKREEEKAAKEKAKQEAKEKKEKERQERKEQADRERLEKMQQKEEEKKKKQELLDAKAEEKRKKEEEKRQKEEEKHKEEEEEAKLKEKQKKTFKNFFVEVKPATPKATEKETGTFKPFQLLQGMLLHPNRRPAMTKEEQNVLDAGLQDQACQCLYLEQLRKGEAGKGRSTRTLPRDSQEEDVELLGHDSEVVKKVTHHVKFLKFHTNYRPPYYGTWSKKSRFISPRNPFKKDEHKLDYEVDSDEEWEEEEPGESLSSSEGEQERDEDEEDDDEDGWMVPHGYLSEGEGCEDDEEVSPEVLRARRAAKLEAWEAELKQRCRPVRAVVHGCYWEHEDSTVPPESVTFLEQFQTVCLWELPISTLPRVEEAGEAGGDKPCGTPGSSKGPLKKSVPEEAMPDLVRLVHGNELGIKRLIKEFRMYWREKTKPTNASPETSAEPMDVDGAEAKPAPGTPSTAAAECPATPCTAEMDEEGGEQKDEFSMSKRQLEIRINEIAARERRPQCKKTCWYVHADVLERYDCSGLVLPNQWQYVSGVKKERQAAAASAAEDVTSGNKSPTSASAEVEEEVAPEGTPPSNKALPKDQRSIMDFARRLEQSALTKSTEEGSTPKEAGKDEPKDAPPPTAAAAAEAAEVGNKTPGKSLPKDQLSIMSFAKPAGELSKSASATQEKGNQGSTLRSAEATSPGKTEKGKTDIEPIFID